MADLPEEHFCDVAIFIQIGYETLIGGELTQMKNGILVTFSVRVWNGRDRSHFDEVKALFESLPGNFVEIKQKHHPSLFPVLRQLYTGMATVGKRSPAIKEKFTI